jgi:hypothetical protein
MFSFGPYSNNQMSTTDEALGDYVDAAEHPDIDEANGPTQNATMQEFSNTMSDTTKTAPGNNNMEVIDADMDHLLAQVNEELERELKETKKAVKRIFKEMVTFHQVAQKIHAQWAPILEAERQEAVRLDELQAEVEGTIGALPGIHLAHPSSDPPLEPESSI